MKKVLADLIDNTIVFKYNLPNTALTYDRSAFSTVDDHCYECVDDNNLAEIIYNSIVDYSFNQFDIGMRDYNDLLAIALKNKIRYNPKASRKTKISYGFHGETILFCILYAKLGAKPVLSRGYFYNPLESSETKGYDSYHLVDNSGTTELWFGEVKFRQTYGSGLKSAIDNLNTAISDQYLSQNFMALHTRKNNFNIPGSTIENIINQWDMNPHVDIIDEVKKHNIKLIYPIVLLYNLDASGYDSSISKALAYIKANHSAKVFAISIPYEVYFIFLPIQKVKAVKTSVIEWIELKKPLL